MTASISYKRVLCNKIDLSKIYSLTTIVWVMEKGLHWWIDLCHEKIIELWWMKNDKNVDDVKVKRMHCFREMWRSQFHVYKHLEGTSRVSFSQKFTHIIEMSALRFLSHICMCVMFWDLDEPMEKIMIKANGLQ